MFAAATIAFLLLHIAPGDPFTAIGDAAGASPELLEIQRRQFGLDQPLAEQYVRWLLNTAQGHFGWSSFRQQPVADAIASAIPNTLLLMGMALVSSLAFGIMLGAWQGAHAGTRRDRAISTLALIAYSLPEFWLGLALLLLFVRHLHWLPATGMSSPTYDYLTPAQQLVDRVRHFVLPWFVLTLVGTAIFARFQRAAMRETLDEPFVRTARAKGLTESAVRRHALRASLLPVITLAGLLFPALLGGAVFVESVFAWPGMGSLLLEAVHARDYLLVAAAVVIGSAMTTVGSLLADIARTMADPRVVHS